MRKLVVSLASAVALFATAGFAAAADLPVKARPYVSAPAFSWTGIYVGANVGYAWGRTTGTAGIAAPAVGHFDINGWQAGGQIGGNYQIQNWVLGIEADYQWADIDGSATVGAVTDTARVRSYGTLRGRVGYAWDRWMVYGTGGWAFDARTRYTFATPAAFSGSRDLNGWAAGAGVEYAFAPNWSAKLEYLHVDLDSRTFPTLGCAPVACTAGARFDTVRVGLNYRFWGGR